MAAIEAAGTPLLLGPGNHLYRLTLELAHRLPDDDPEWESFETISHTLSFTEKQAAYDAYQAAQEALTDPWENDDPPTSRVTFVKDANIVIYDLDGAVWHGEAALESISEFIEVRDLRVEALDQ